MTAARGRNPAEELARQTTPAAETSGDSWLCGFSSAWNALVHELCCLAQPRRGLTTGKDGHYKLQSGHRPPGLSGFVQISSCASFKPLKTQIEFVRFDTRRICAEPKGW